MAEAGTAPLECANTSLGMSIRHSTLEMDTGQFARPLNKRLKRGELWGLHLNYAGSLAVCHSRFSADSAALHPTAERPPSSTTAMRNITGWNRLSQPRFRPGSFPANVKTGLPGTTPTLAQNLPARQPSDPPEAWQARKITVISIPVWLVQPGACTFSRSHFMSGILFFDRQKEFLRG